MIDKCIGIFPKAFDNSFCDSIIKSYNLAEEHGYTRSRIQSEKVGTLLKNDSSIHLEHIDESLELKKSAKNGVTKINNQNQW